MRYLPHILLLTATLSLLCACDTGQTTPRKPQDQPTDTRPTRIVSMAPNVTEILFAIGAGDEVVAVTKFCNFPPEAEKLPNVGGLVDPDLERILALEPTIVIGVKSQHSDRIDKAVDKEKTQTIWLNVEALGDVYSAIATIGRAVNREEQADETVHKMKASMTTQTLARRPTGLILFGVSPYIAAGRDTFAHTMLEMAGAENALGPESASYANLDLETLIVLDPDFIIDATVGESEFPESIKTRDGKKRVHKLPNVDVMRPGPRLIQADAFFKDVARSSITP